MIKPGATIGTITITISKASNTQAQAIKPINIKAATVPAGHWVMAITLINHLSELK
jgi:hypothetical protein